MSPSGLDAAPSGTELRHDSVVVLAYPARQTPPTQLATVTPTTGRKEALHAIGIVELADLGQAPGIAVGRLRHTRAFRGSGGAGARPPGLEAWRYRLTVRAGREAVAPGTALRYDGAIGGAKALRLP
jgi:hypothetical protein